MKKFCLYFCSGTVFLLFVTAILYPLAFSAAVFIKFKNINFQHQMCQIEFNNSNGCFITNLRNNQTYYLDPCIFQENDTQIACYTRNENSIPLPKSEINNTILVDGLYALNFLMLGGVCIILVVLTIRFYLDRVLDHIKYKTMKLTEEFLIF